ncbi:hypothetical protein [Acidovorax sp. PRC11]|nr:hypothetical protein [Acidovorax sp. PRC11]MDT0136641.1 hypothetical protein [Acidovorax sp. PRC11]
MSLFSWFSRKKTPSRPHPAAEPTGLLDADATVPLMGRGGRPAAPPAPVEHAANRKNERMERRELLYTVVRDAMVRASVLSAGYKFKVLSLDQRGRQFLVMIDLAREYGGETMRLSEIEALIAQTAKTRFDILVTAVYWRISDHVAVGVPGRTAPHPAAAVPHAAAAHGPVHPPQQQPARAPTQGHAAPAPAQAPLLPPNPARAAAPEPAPRSPRSAPAIPAPVPAVAASAPAGAPGRGFEPIEADEVAAFRRALGHAAIAPGTQVRSGPLLPAHGTGYDDEETSGRDRASSPDLSNTQYGELR